MTEYGDKGHVEPDGPAIERRDGHLLIRKFSVEEMDNNVYVVACARTNDALVIDAAARADRIRQELAGVSPVAVVQTHGHWDHVRAWDDLKEDPGLQIWGHPGDAELFPGPVDVELTDGDEIEVGDLRVEVIHTPGHTDGSLHFLVEGEERPHLFTGDSLFPGGPGNTWKDAEKFTQLMDGLESKLFDRLPDETWVYPGHGDDTTLGAERPKLGEWRERGW
ncbi:MAG: MBL fold metallo-hydrolase [Actinobacteria bacterium]|nr:MBL fold metallo-hydrolase [Actinomycetota bacterium]